MEHGFINETPDSCLVTDLHSQLALAYLRAHDREYFCTTFTIETSHTPLIAVLDTEKSPVLFGLGFGSTFFVQPG